MTNGGNPEGLFRAAFMQSGAVTPVGDITHGQPYYDALVAETGCSGANDTLQCLREVPYDTFLNAMNQSPGVLSYQVRFNVWQGGKWWLMHRMIIRTISKGAQIGMDASRGWGLLDCEPAVSNSTGICCGCTDHQWYVIGRRLFSLYLPSDRTFG